MHDTSQRIDQTQIKDYAVRRAPQPESRTGSTGRSSGPFNNLFNIASPPTVTIGRQRHSAVTRPKKAPATHTSPSNDYHTRGHSAAPGRHLPLNAELRGDYRFTILHLSTKRGPSRSAPSTGPEITTSPPSPPATARPAIPTPRSPILSPLSPPRPPQGIPDSPLPITPTIVSTADRLLPSGADKTIVPANTPQARWNDDQLIQALRDIPRYEKHFPEI
ncbi:hypothetical protein JTB14_031019 [Gonioctena quinquepunctata]|nr:hypothetical protein JTB14_031019 [Gonioctena quinquepunctata]